MCVRSQLHCGEIAELRAKLDIGEEFLEKDSDLFDEHCSKANEETTAEGQDHGCCEQ